MVEPRYQKHCYRLKLVIKKKRNPKNKNREDCIYVRQLWTKAQYLK